MKFKLQPNAKDWVYSEPQSTIQVVFSMLYNHNYSGYNYH